MDTETHEALTEAVELVQAVEKRTGLKIACLEEVALCSKWISKEVINTRIAEMKGDCFDYLKAITGS